MLCSGKTEALKHLSPKTHQLWRHPDRWLSLTVKWETLSFLDGKITSTQLQFGCITRALSLLEETLFYCFCLVGCCATPHCLPVMALPFQSSQWLSLVLPISFSLCDKIYVCNSEELASSFACDFIIPHSTLSLPALQLEQVQQTSRDTRLFSVPQVPALWLLWTDLETRSQSFERGLLNPGALRINTEQTANVCFPVFTIKVNILCFVCAADASLWGDHLMLSPGGKPSIRVYGAWSIKIDISNFAIWDAGRQDAAASGTYGSAKRCSLEASLCF